MSSRRGEPVRAYIGATAGMAAVDYPNIKGQYVKYQTRQDIMRLASRIAASKGEKSGGVKATNAELVEYITKNLPWEASQVAPAKATKPKLAKHNPEPSLMPTVTKDGRIAETLSCDCGHTYTYRIRADRYESTKKWLESKPCPPCQKKDEAKPSASPAPDATPPEEEATPPEPEEENTVPIPSTQELDLDTLADLLVQKVQERMQPVKMPELHHKTLPELVRCVQAGVPVWMKGPPGTGKSEMGRQTAEAVGRDFYSISCHEAMTRSDMFGYTDANGTDHRSPLWDAFEKGGVLLLDEIDNGNANILAALNSALSNGYCNFAGRTVQKHPDFAVLAAANTAGLGPEAGFIGRMGVDLATLDRFVQVFIDIDNDLETALVKAILPKEYKTVLKAVRRLRRVVEDRGLRCVVSPRTSIHSAKLVRAGFELRTAIERTALKGMDATTTESLLREAL